MRTTWEEPEEGSEQEVALLTYVLGFDDLGADGSTTFPLEDRARLAIGGREAGSLAMHGEMLDLPDRWASSRHAELRRTAAGFSIRDLGSRNGTYVNGVRVQDQHLLDGDSIEVGHSLLVYRLASADHATALGGEMKLGPTATHNPRVAAMNRDLMRLAPTTEPVLLLGETGTGKDFVARALHAASGRTGPLVPIDCGAVPDALFESTFFGHRRGAFTGAADAHVGAIMRAERGTLFFDEIGNLSPAAQAKLLRVLEDKAVTPLGGAQPERVDVRWVAATNSRLLDAPGTFRSDLLQRLAGFSVELLPLRQRREDLGVLTAHILREASFEDAAISASAARKLYSDPFAGNIRQLRTALRSAANLAAGSRIELRHLPASSPAGDSVKPAPIHATSPAEDPSAMDSARIEQALIAAKGNVVHAARALNTHPRQLYRVVDRLGLELAKFRR